MVVVSLLAAAAAFGIARLSGPASAGRLAYVSDRGLVFRDLTTGAEELAAELPSGIGEVRLSPDGDRVAYRDRDGAVVLLAVGSGTTERIVLDGRPASFSPDGDILPVVRRVAGDRETLVARIDGSVREIVPGGFGGVVGDVVWVDEASFAVHVLDRDRERGASFVVELVDGIPSLAHQVPDVVPLAASPDGAEVLLAAADGGPLRILSREGFRLRDVGLEGRFDAAAVSPSGVPVVSGTTPDGQPGVWVLTADGDPVVISSRRPDTLVWSPSGTHVLAASGRDLLAISVADRRVAEVGSVDLAVPFLAAFPG